MSIRVRNRHEAHRVVNTASALSLLASLEQLRYEKGEERLMLAVLKDAVECIERYRYEYGSRSRSTYHEALHWVRGRDRTWLFSFENVCLGLDLDPMRLRSLLDDSSVPLRY